MNALNIVLVSVISIVIICVCAYFLILYLYTRFKTNQSKEYTLFNQMAQPHKTVMLGDSITELYRLEEFFPDIILYNRGISGNTTAEVLTRLYDNVINIIPARVFIQIGTNDLAKNGDRVINNAYKNIIKIIETLINEIENVKIYVVSIYPVNRLKSKTAKLLMLESRRNDRINKLNHMLNDYCIANNIKYIDVFTHLLDEQNNLNKEYTIEGLHLTFKGYEAVTKILAQYIYTDDFIYNKNAVD